MKKSISLIMAIVMILCCLTLASCKEEAVIIVLHPDNGESSRIIHYYSDTKLPTDYVKAGYTFGGWYYDENCTDPFNPADELSGRVHLYAKWNDSSSDNNNDHDKPAAHTHNFGDSYFAFVKCSVEGCNVMGRNTSDGEFKNSFQFTFTQVDAAELDSMYTSLLNYVNGGTVTAETVKSKFRDYDGEYTDLEYQYQVATVLNSVYADDAWGAKLDLIDASYNSYIQNYYLILGAIDGSRYKTAFFSDWSQSEYDEAMEAYQAYSSSGDNLQTAANNRASEYNDILQGLGSRPTSSQLQRLYSAYGEFVKANNAIAAQYGNKYANFMEYSYANDYNREYTPSQVSSMRALVKQYIAPALINVYQVYNSFEGFSTQQDMDYYRGLCYNSLFTIDADNANATYAAVNRISDYFQYLNNNVSGKDGINYYSAVNELFKTGNYFTGKEEGAYTYWIPNKELSIVFFGDNCDQEYDVYDYSTAFTFVHEFGHYYNGVYNGSLPLSMDHDETQSQGNEMLFLAYLKQNLPSGVTDGYGILECDQLFNILCTIVQSTIVDEFEQAVYSNTYGSGQYSGGIDPSKYGDLYEEILASYGEGMADILGTDYWQYVVVDSPAYYISYAMSALPSLEIFVKAQQGGLNSARDSYFKLYTFSRNQASADTNGDGTVTYREALNYAGLGSPFSASLYTAISEYFADYSL